MFYLRKSLVYLSPLHECGCTPFQPAFYHFGEESMETCLLSVCNPGQAVLQLLIHIAGQLHRFFVCMSLPQRDLYTQVVTEFYGFLVSSIICVDCLILYFFLQGGFEKGEIKMTTEFNQ